MIYTIPANSPLHYVTYVRVYGSTNEEVYVGYTPGYYGTVPAMAWWCMAPDILAMPGLATSVQLPGDLRLRQQLCLGPGDRWSLALSAAGSGAVPGATLVGPWYGTTRPIILATGWRCVGV